MVTLLWPTTPERRTLWVASLLHVWNDAFFALLYPLLPFIAADLALSYTETGLLRTLFMGASGVAQLPAGLLAGRLGEFALLIAGNLWVAGGLVSMGAAPSYLWLLAASALTGLGGGPQHPLASSLVSRVYDRAWRSTAIGTLNFAGDLGKLAGPALVGLLAVGYGWRFILVVVGVAGVAATALLGATRRSLRTQPVAPGEDAPEAVAAPAGGATPRGAFAWMALLGVLDAATRGAALTFLPFVLAEKGLGEGAIATLFILVFAGGAAGKLACGWLGDRVGALGLVWVTKGVVAALLVGFFPAPVPSLAVLVLVFGFGLNGTSSVLYAGVARLVPVEQRARGYAYYYTATEGGTAAAPALYGLVADFAGLAPAMAVMAAATAAILPASLALRRYLA